MSDKSVKTLGLWTLTALVAGNMVGSGIFLLPSSLAKFGTIGITAWIFTAIGTLFLARIFSRLSLMYPKTGGPYVYCHEAYGDFIGFQVAYNYWIGMWVGNAAIAVTFVGYMAYFFPAINHSGQLAFLLIIGVLWFITFINALGVKEAGRVQLLTTVLKLIPLMVIGSFGLMYIQKSNLMQFNVSGLPHMSALTAAATLTMWSFIGFESATVPADDAINPEKNIPRATMLGTSIAALVYIFCTTCIMGVIPMKQLAQSTSPFAEAAAFMFGPWGGAIVAAAGAIACFGTLNGWVLLQGQVPYAAAKDGLFPMVFAKVSKNGVPVFGLVFSSVLITALLVLQRGLSMVALYEHIILLATLAQLVPYAYTSLAEILSLAKKTGDFQFRRFWRSTVLAAIGFIYCFWAIYGAGETVIAYGTLLFLSGIPFYILLQARK